MIVFSRFFLLPVRFQGFQAGRHGWGGGEFEYPVRVTYMYGINPSRDEDQFGFVRDLCLKMCAIDLYTNTDYSKIIVSGTDRVTLQQKIDDWQTEVDEGLADMKGWTAW